MTTGMRRDDQICAINGREVLDSRGNPTVECEVCLRCGLRGRAMVPSGASTGKYEAVELRDGKPLRYDGKGVETAVSHINTKIASELEGRDPTRQVELDRAMLELDGTPDKSHLGANAILAVSLAVARAGAKVSGLPLYRYLGGALSNRLPLPLVNILNGGAHADNTVDFQEIMIAPVGAESFREAVRMGAEIFHGLGTLLQQHGYATTVGDEGGYAPNLESNQRALELVTEAVQKSNYNPENQVKLALDCAAGELYDEDEQVYFLESENAAYSSRELIDYYQNWVELFPVASIEDGLHEDDWDGWSMMTDEFGEELQLVGDDLFVTNRERIRGGVEAGIANAVLIKVNQIGTLTETLQAVEQAHRSGYRTVISHRSGETEDTFISDLAVGLRTGQIKTGSMSRSERTAKYNKLLRIEDRLDSTVQFDSDIF